jgi:hypothetical protein
MLSGSCSARRGRTTSVSGSTTPQQDELLERMRGGARAGTGVR